MESRNSNERPAARGYGHDGEGNLQIPPQTAELILGEVAAGAELSAVARKYGIAPETILAWQAGKIGEIPDLDCFATLDSHRCCSHIDKRLDHMGDHNHDRARLCMVFDPGKNFFLDMSVHALERLVEQDV